MSQHLASVLWLHDFSEKDVWQEGCVWSWCTASNKNQWNVEVNYRWQEIYEFGSKIFQRSSCQEFSQEFFKDKITSYLHDLSWSNHLRPILGHPSPLGRYRNRKCGAHHVCETGPSTDHHETFFPPPYQRLVAWFCCSRYATFRLAKNMPVPTWRQAPAIPFLQTLYKNPSSYSKKWDLHAHTQQNQVYANVIPHTSPILYPKWFQVLWALKVRHWLWVCPC